MLAEHFHRIVRPGPSGRAAGVAVVAASSPTEAIAASMTTIPDSICKSHAQATCDFWETSAPFALSLVQLRSSTKRVYSLCPPKLCKQSSSFCFRSCPCPAHPQPSSWSVCRWSLPRSIPMTMARRRTSLRMRARNSTTGDMTRGLLALAWGEGGGQSQRFLYFHDY